MKKQRLDVLLVERELTPNRTQAKARIMAGEVLVNEQRIDKAGTLIAPNAEISLKGEANPFASRGGLKLNAAIEEFHYDCTDKVVIDVGASTGGFTDCVLQNGASRVYAVDVGYGQLAWKLRQDPRVVVMERMNIRHLKGDQIPEKCDLAVIDCSFISMELVLPNTLNFLKPGADIIALIKPQFEVGPDNLGKGGVVRDMEKRQEAIEAIIDSAANLGLEMVQTMDCPVHGPAGNIENLTWFRLT